VYGTCTLQLVSNLDEADKVNQNCFCKVKNHGEVCTGNRKERHVKTSVMDPDPYVFGPP